MKIEAFLSRRMVRHLAICGPASNTEKGGNQHPPWVQDYDRGRARSPLASTQTLRGGWVTCRHAAAHRAQQAGAFGLSLRTPSGWA
eukprot:scaffold21605_cov143-Isochrysis_galbana.AAC.1